MLQLNATVITKTNQAPMVPSNTIDEEGQALVYVRIDGNLHAQVSTGAANETFAGFALARNTPPHFIPFFVEGVVPADGKIILPRLPVAGQILVKVSGEIRTLTASGAAPVDADTTDLSGAAVRFHAEDIGLKYAIQFHYEATVAEASQLTGDNHPGGLMANVMGFGSFIEIGDVCTNMFDASCDWSSVMHPKLGPKGTLTTKGNGTELTNVLVRSAPNSENGFLVVTVR